MKKNSFFVLSILMLFALSIKAQQTEKQASYLLDGKNLIKLNLTALPLNNYSFQYERVVAKKMTVAMGIRLMPNGGLPLKSTIKGFFDDDDEDFKNQIDNFKIGNFAITPEVRFYTGKQALRGFYLAPFARYATYSADIPIEYEYEDENGNDVTETIGLDGKVTGLTAGLMIGAQWKLSKLVYLDWWILGPHYGTSDGEINGRKSLSPEEQDAIRDELANLEDLPLVKVTTSVDSDGATAKFSGPWAGIRAGLSIGFRF